MEQTKKQVKRQKVQSFLYNIGKFIIDGAKLCFGSVVLGSVIRGDIPPTRLITGGIIATVVGAVIGILLVTYMKEK